VPRGVWLRACRPRRVRGRTSATSGRKKFHRPDCKWAAKMNPGDRIYFKTREKAIGQECTPCKV